MPHTKKQKKKDINNFILSLLTLFGIGALTVGCGASKIDESFIAENQKLKSELNKLKAEKEKLKQEKERLAEAKQNNKDANDCKEGSIIGGVLGAGLTMSSTKGKDRWWAVPLGATAGSLVGCQIDGG